MIPASARMTTVLPLWCFYRLKITPNQIKIGLHNGYLLIIKNTIAANVDPIIGPTIGTQA